MMKSLKPFLSIILLLTSITLYSQAPTFEEMEFEPDSVSKPYKPAGKNFAFVRSKRGTSGVNKTPEADKILSKEISEIVLVYSESDPSMIAYRDDANRERWENLLKTYPEFFQFSTVYKNMCQCDPKADSSYYKQVQGFYVYYTSDEPVVEEKKVEEKKPVAKAPEEKKAEQKKSAPAEVAREEKAEKKADKRKEEPVAEKPKKENTRENKKEEKVAEQPAAKEPEEEAEAAPVVKASPVKKAGYTKPRKAKDPRACAPPCYENGDEDLNAFFREKMVLSKKQKRHGKSLMTTLRIQLNLDGSIKKTMVAGPDEEINTMALVACNMMNNWNPAVKAGSTVKSEVKITLKYDKETKSMKPFETMITPRPGPKCKCMTESDLQ